MTTDYQATIDGLDLGAGTDFILHEVSGLGIPAFRVSDTEEPLRHGVSFGHDLLEARRLTLELTVRGDTPSDVSANIRLLRQAWFLDSSDDMDAIEPLLIKLEGEPTFRLHGRPRRMAMTTGRIISGHARVTLEYVAGDPRLYSESEESVVINYVASGSTGYGYVRSYPRTYGGTSTSNTVNASSDGTVPTLPTIEIEGPCTNPQVEHVEKGRVLSFDLELESGDVLTLDAADRSVVLNGSTNRFGALDSAQWFELDPGDNTIRFQVAGTTGAPSATITWRDARV